MTTAAVLQASCSKIQHAHKDSGEHSSTVALTCNDVHILQNAGRGIFLGSHRAEHRLAHGHHQCRRNSLSTHIADIEEKLAAPYKKVIEVSAHLFCRHLAPGNIEAFLYIHRTATLFGKLINLRRIRQHGRLDAVCDVQFLVDQVLLGTDFAQATHAANTAIHDESQQQ